MGNNWGNELFTEIPSVDLEKFNSGSPSEKEEFIKKLGDSFTGIGFVAVKNHGLDPETQNQLYKTWQDFFALDDSTKLKYEVPNLAGQRGYTSKGVEHAKGRNVGDLKEFFQLGQLKQGEDSIFSEYPDNLWPEEIQGIKEVSEKVYRQFESSGKQLLKAIALYLGLEENYFEPKVQNGNSILRAIHYFPIMDPDSVEPDAVRAAEHGDINLITLLMGASAEGLQVLRKDGEWIPITALDDHIVVNVGDMLERLTNKRLSSTLHRVVNPPREKLHLPRYSMPFFMHPRSEMDLSCLPSCIDEEHPKSFPDTTAGEFLEQRLREIGLRDN